MTLVLLLLAACGAKAPPHGVGFLSVSDATRTPDGVELHVRNDGPRDLQIVAVDVGFWDPQGPQASTRIAPALVLTPGQADTLQAVSEPGADIVRVTGTVTVVDPHGAERLVIFDVEPR